MATAAELLILIKARDEASATIDHATGRLGSFKQMAQTAAGTFAGFLSANAAIGAMRSAWDAASGSIIGFNSQMQQAQIGFTTMLGSGDRAAAFLKDLQQFAAQTPFEFPELVQASQRMLAMGFSADKVRPILTSVGDAVAALGGSGELVGRVTTALGQMQAKGKVSAEEMLQLTEAGIPAWQMLADAIGVSVPEAMKLAEKGAISSGQAIDAITAGMNQRFGGMMAKQSQTFAGAMSTIKDSLNIAVGTAFKPFFDVLSRGGVALAGFLSSDRFAAWSATATALLGQVIGRVGGLAAELGPLAGALAGAFREDLLPKLQAMGEFFQDRILPAVQSLAAEISSRLVPVFERFGGFIAENKEIWGGVAIAVGGALVAAFAALAVSAGSAAVSMIAAAAPVIAIAAAVAALTAGIIWLVKNWDTAVERFPALGTAADAAGKALAATWEFIRDQVGAFVDWWTGIWPSVQEAAVNVWHGIQAAAEFVVDVAVRLWRAAGDDIIGIARAFWEYLKTTFDNLKTIVQNAVELIVNLINGNWSQAWENAKTIVGAFVSQVVAYVVELPAKVAPHLLALAGRFLSWIAEDVLPFLGEKLGDILVALGRWLIGDAIPWAGREMAKLGGAIVDAIKGGVSAGWGAFESWLMGQLRGIRDRATEMINPANWFRKSASGGENKSAGGGGEADGSATGAAAAMGAAAGAAFAEAAMPSMTRNYQIDTSGLPSVRVGETTNAFGLAGLTHTTLSENGWQVELFNTTAALRAVSSQFDRLLGAFPAGTDLPTALGFTSADAFKQWSAVAAREAANNVVTFAQAQGAFAGTSGGGMTAGDIMAGMSDQQFEGFLGSLPTGERERARQERERAQAEQTAAARDQRTAADDQKAAGWTQGEAGEQQAENVAQFGEAVDAMPTPEDWQQAREDAAAAGADDRADDEDQKRKKKKEEEEAAAAGSVPAHAEGGIISEFARLVNAAGRTVGTMAEAGPEAIVPVDVLGRAVGLIGGIGAGGGRQIGSISRADLQAAIAAGVAAGLDGALVQMDGQEVGRLVTPFISRELGRDALLAGINR